MNLMQLKNLWEGSFQSFTSLLRVVFLSKKSTGIRKLSVKASNKSLLILGNGPSLQETIGKYDLCHHSVDKLCVNAMAEAPVYKEIKPNYYVLISPELFNPHLEQKYLDRADRLFSAIRDNTTWEMTLFIPAKLKKYKTHLKYFGDMPHVKIQFYNSIPIEGFTSFRHKLFAMNLGMPRPHNVLIPAILLGINMAYQQLIVVGAEHSWLDFIKVDQHNNVLLNQKHFYDQQKSSYEPMNKYGKGSRKLHEVLEKFYITFKSHFFLRYYADSRNVTIYNASPSSYIDAFPKKAFDQIDI